MQAYTGFAQVYDIFMDNVPYDLWTDYLTGLLREYGIDNGLVLELGCGTGSITRRLAGKGYDMIGIDNSEEMLEIARYKQYEDIDGVVFDGDTGFDVDAVELVKDITELEKDAVEPVRDITELDEDAEYTEENPSDLQARKSILYLQQDMRDFELYGTVAAVVSICDSINYITSEEDLLTVFKLVNNYLDAGGNFIFDMNTEYKYKYILANNTIAENREECSFIWDNYYYEDKKINEYDVTIFVKLEEEEMEEKLEEELEEELEEDLKEELEEDLKEELEEDLEKELEDCLEEDVNKNMQEADLTQSSNGNQKSSSDLYERYQEIHYQKAYSIEIVKNLLEEAGMEFVAVYDAFTHNAPNEKSERVYFIAKEKYQADKKYI